MGLTTGRSKRGEAVTVTWQHGRQARAAERAERALQAAQRSAEAAAERYQALRAAAADPTAAPAEAAPPRRPMPTWQQLLLLVFGGGVLAGLLMMWFLASAYLGPVALLALPAGAGIVVGLRKLRQRRQVVAGPPRRRPLVSDLVRAAQEMHDAEAALQRMREQGPPERRAVPLDAFRVRGVRFSRHG